MVTKALRALVAMSVVLAGSYAHPAIYRMDVVAGDTTALTALNDVGTLVLAGFSDFVCATRGAGMAGMSAILPPPYPPPLGGRFVAGLPAVPPGQGWEVCGVFVTGINSAGDMIGTSFRDGVRVPTLWQDGIAYDLRDPANSGLAFAPDPGVRRVPFDFASLDVINLSDFPFIGPPADWDFVFPNSAWTNAGGLFAFELNTTFRPSVVLIPVSEPPLIALVMLGALVGARYYRRSVRS